MESWLGSFLMTELALSAWQMHREWSQNDTADIKPDGEWLAHEVGVEREPLAGTEGELPVEAEGEPPMGAKGEPPV